MCSLLWRCLREVHAVPSRLFVLNELEVVGRHSKLACLRERRQFELLTVVRALSSPRKELPSPFSLSIISFVSAPLRSSIRGGSVRKASRILGLSDAGVSGS